MKGYKTELEYFEFLFANLDISIADHEIIFNKQGKAIDYLYTYANKAFCDGLEITKEELIGKSVLEVFPETEDYWIEKYCDVVKTGKPLSMTNYAKQFDSYFYVHAFKSGENRFIASFKDVTEIMKTTQRKKNINPGSELIKDVSKIGFFEVNRLTYKADVSEAFCDIIGLDAIKEGFFRRTLLKLTHPSDYEEIASLIKKVVAGDLLEFDVEFRMFNERERYYHWMSFFIFAIEWDESGKPFRYTGLVRDIEEEKKQIEEVKEFEDLFKEARRVADLTTFIYDVESETFNKSDELDEFIGLKNLRTLEQFKSIVHPEDLGTYNDATSYTLSNAEGKVTVYRIIKDDKIKIVQSSVFGKTDDNGKTTKVFGIIKDITEIEKERRKAVNAQRSFELILNSSPAGIFLLDSDYEIAMENKTFREIFGTEEKGIKLKQLLGDSYDSTLKLLKKEKEIQHLNINYMINKEERNFVINIVKIAEELRNDYEGTLVDITQQVIDKKRIEYLATHDILTDLYNRNYFEGLIAKKQHNFPLGLIMCDIDGLKLINDAFGHVAGDKLLKSFSVALKKLYPLKTISRIGGDEFTILVENANEDILEKIEQEIKESIKNLGQFGIEFGVSVGYAILDDKNNDFSKVFNRSENMMYHRKLIERSSRKSNALATIMQTLHEKTEETRAHCKRVGDYSSMLLSEAGYKRLVDLDDIRFLSDVHDIGKIAIPDSILAKPSKLTEEEYEEIKYHSEAGFKIIKNIIDKEDIAYGVLYHHERYDGKGYPHGIKGENIPLYARILAIADAYDTMIRGRVYQKPISKEKALEEIRVNSGTQFDPKLAASFIKIMKNNND